MENTPKTINDSLASGRESFAGRLLTDRQFSEAIQVTKIMEQSIHQSGAFRDKLSDYAYAFSRTEHMSPIKSEETIRDLFKHRTGQTMNQMRERLKNREDDFQEKSDGNTNKARKLSLTENQHQQALNAAHKVGDMMRSGDKITFHRAMTHQGGQLAKEIGVTEKFSCQLMSHSFKQAEGKEFREWGKDIEEKHYRVQVNAEIQARESNQGMTRSRA